jgi:hypothetical protein
MVNREGWGGWFFASQEIHTERSSSYVTVHEPGRLLPW